MAASILPPIPERVVRGAQLLDTHKPDWADQIDVEVLDEDAAYRELTAASTAQIHARQTSGGGV